MLKSTQYKKLLPNGLRFTYRNFEILQITWFKWNKEHHTLSFQFLSINLTFWCFLFCFLCGLQDFKFYYVNCKAFEAKFLYWVDFTFHSFLAGPSRNEFTVHNALPKRPINQLKSAQQSKQQTISANYLNIYCDEFSKVHRTLHQKIITITLKWPLQ